MLNQSKWNKLHSEKRFRPKYPEDDIVRWLFKNMPPHTNILDDGCGAGRHIMLLADNDYIPYGIDYSENGVNYTRELLVYNNYSQYVNNIQVASCDELPFDNNFFDGLISFGVLYYLEECKISKAINEIYRVLKNGGKTVVVVRNKEDYRYSSDTTVSVDDNKLSGFNENGMSQHFFSKEEIIDLFSDFSDLSVERIIRTHNNESISDNDYIIFAEK